MDDERFDALSRLLGNGATRRGALGILAGIAGLGLGEVAAKRRNRRRGKGRVRAQEANPNKRDVCHYDEETGTYHLINIDDSAVQKHLDNHGDFFPAPEDGCCTDADCLNEGEACVLDEATNTAACEATCSQTDPCFGQVGCGDGCGTVIPVPDGGCFCHQGAFCDDLQACESTEDCLQEGYVCADSCCAISGYGILCHPPCGAALRAARAEGAGDGPRSISGHLAN